MSAAVRAAGPPGAERPPVAPTPPLLPALNGFGEAVMRFSRSAVRSSIARMSSFIAGSCEVDGDVTGTGVGAVGEGEEPDAAGPDAGRGRVEDGGMAPAEWRRIAARTVARVAEGIAPSG
jgi:hypothetical protein